MFEKNDRPGKIMRNNSKWLQTCTKAAFHTALELYLRIRLSIISECLLVNHKQLDLIRLSKLGFLSHPINLGLMTAILRQLS